MSIFVLYCTFRMLLAATIRCRIDTNPMKYPLLLSYYAHVLEYKCTSICVLYWYICMRVHILIEYIAHIVRVNTINNMRIRLMRAVCMYMRTYVRLYLHM